MLLTVSTLYFGNKKYNKQWRFCRNYLLFINFMYKIDGMEVNPFSCKLRDGSMEE